MKKIGVLLSGCGVYDGSEIHEATLALLCLAQANLEAVCFAPNHNQHHVINHKTGEVSAENRNILVESARIARGKVEDLATVNFQDLDALLIPGGFGAAKNLSSWAFQGAEAEVLPAVKACMQHFISHKKPIVALCIAPTLLAKSLQGVVVPTLSFGNEARENIRNTHAEIAKTGATTISVENMACSVDEKNKIICAPCYMMDYSIAQVYVNIQNAVKHLQTWL